MNENQNSILDDKFEVAGRWPSSQHQEDKDKKKKWAIAIAICMAFALILVAVLALLLNRERTPDIENGVFDPIPIAVRPSLAPLGKASAVVPYTEKMDTVINDVILSIYIPHQSIAELTIGIPSIEDKSIILAAQAADIRADNGKILGAFVYKGEPKAWGLSKRGYCAIIDGIVTVGVSDNSPLFEEATERGGYFFRQYPLVDNGNVVENEPKNKTMRKALCSRSGQILMIVSESDESFHDFAQALVDLGVDNAVYLVGGHTSYGWYQNESGMTEEFAPSNARKVFKNETYIFWRAVN